MADSLNRLRIESFEFGRSTWRDLVTAAIPSELGFGLSVTRPAAVSIIIPNMDGAHLLRSCLSFLPRDDNVEVIVVDNGSKDESIQVVREIRPDAYVVAIGDNVGFASACNCGAHRASAPYLLFLNNDVRVEEGTVLQLLEYARTDGEAAAWQPKLLRTDGSWDSAGSYFTYSGFLWHSEMGVADRDAFTEPRDVFAVKGACMLVCASAFEHVGGFDESFFAYYEESDLCWRLRLAGWKIRVVPTCAAFHEVGLTTRRLFRSSEIDYLSFRNRLISILSNGSPTTIARVLPVHIACSIAVAAIFFATGRWRTALAILRAFRDVVRSPAFVVERRARVQRLRRHGDGVVLGPVSVGMTPARGLVLLKAYLPRW